jgi:transcriptional regulator with GAF, ATPase, and Fis domain
VSAEQFTEKGAYVSSDEGVRRVADQLVGRSRELERIRVFLDVVAASGASRLVFGEPGVGKTCFWQLRPRRQLRRACECSEPAASSSKLT